MPGKEVVGVAPQDLKQLVEYRFLGVADFVFVVPHGGFGDAKLFGQFALGEAEALPPGPYLFANAHC